MWGAGQGPKQPPPRGGGGLLSDGLPPPVHPWPSFLQFTASYTLSRALTTPTACNSCIQLLNPSTPLHTPPHPSTPLHTPPHPATPLHTPPHPSTPLHTPPHCAPLRTVPAAKGPRMVEGAPPRAPPPPPAARMRPCTRSPALYATPPKPPIPTFRRHPHPATRNRRSFCHPLGKVGRTRAAPLHSAPGGCVTPFPPPSSSLRAGWGG